MTLRVAIVDDEALARLRLRQLLADCADPAVELIGEAGDAEALRALLERSTVDVLLLDIGLPGRDGTRIAAELQALPARPLVVFVTAHPEHALRAFELDAADYVTKPVGRERLHAALRRAALRLPARSTSAREAPSLIATDRGRIVRVPVGDVLYLKAELKYVTLRTREHTHVLDESLAELERRLGDRFVRVHRNALVARDAMRALERRSIEADDDGAAGEGWAVRVAPTQEWLAVSRRQVALVKEVIAGRAADASAAED